MLVIRKVRPCDAEAIADIYNYYVLETTVSFELQPVDAKEMHQRINMVSSSFLAFTAPSFRMTVARSLGIATPIRGKIGLHTFTRLKQPYMSLSQVVVVGLADY